MSNRLVKSDTNRMIAGVCGGIGEYMNIDPTLVRIGMVIFALFMGSGLLLYILCAIIIPRNYY